MQTFTSSKPVEMRQTLPYFIGSQKYYVHRFLNLKLNITEGVKYIRDTADCFWLMDLIAVTINMYPVPMRFCLCYRSHTDDWYFTAKSLYNDKTLHYKKVIDYSDFPLESIEILFANNIVYLQSED